MSRFKIIFLRLLLAAVAVSIIYMAADKWATLRWNNDESLIVEIMKMGPESTAPTSNETYMMLERDLTVLLMTGEQAGTTVDIKVVRLAGSGVDLTPGRRYLLVADTFQDGSVQYSIADAYRVPSLAAFVSGVCLILIVFSGWSGFLALLGLALSVAMLVFVMIPLMSEGCRQCRWRSPLCWWFRL